MNNLYPWIKLVISVPALLVALWILSSSLKEIVGNVTLTSVSPFWMLLICCAFTALVQSSSFTILLLVGLMSGGIIPLEMGIAGVIGANVGTTITAWIGSIPFGLEAKQLALSHTILNLLLLVMYPFIDKIAWICRSIIK